MRSRLLVVWLVTLIFVFPASSRAQLGGSWAASSNKAKQKLSPPAAVTETAFVQANTQSGPGAVRQFTHSVLGFSLELPVALEVNQTDTGFSARGAEGLEILSYAGDMGDPLPAGARSLRETFPPGTEVSKGAYETNTNQPFDHPQGEALWTFSRLVGRAGGADITQLDYEIYFHIDQKRWLFSCRQNLTGHYPERHSEPCLAAARSFRTTPQPAPPAGLQRITLVEGPSFELPAGWTASEPPLHSFPATQGFAVFFPNGGFLRFSRIEQETLATLRKGVAAAFNPTDLDLPGGKAFFYTYFGGQSRFFAEVGGKVWLFECGVDLENCKTAIRSFQVRPGPTPSSPSVSAPTDPRQPLAAQAAGAASAGSGAATIEELTARWSQDPRVSSVMPRERRVGIVRDAVRVFELCQTLNASSRPWNGGAKPECGCMAQVRLDEWLACSGPGQRCGGFDYLPSPSACVASASTPNDPRRPPPSAPPPSPPVQAPTVTPVGAAAVALAPPAATPSAGAQVAQPLEPVGLERSVLPSLTGTYRAGALDAVVALRPDGVLTYTVQGQPPYELQWTSGLSFTVRGIAQTSIEFQRAASGSVTGLIAHFYNGDLAAQRVGPPAAAPASSTVPPGQGLATAGTAAPTSSSAGAQNNPRRPPPAATPPSPPAQSPAATPAGAGGAGDKAVLDSLVGDYQAQATVVSVRLRADGVLAWSVPGQPAYELQPLGALRFALKNLTGYVSEFIRDPSGAVVAVIAHQPNGDFGLTRMGASQLTPPATDTSQRAATVPPPTPQPQAAAATPSSPSPSAQNDPRRPPPSAPPPSPPAQSPAATPAGAGGGLTFEEIWNLEPLPTTGPGAALVAKWSKDPRLASLPPQDRHRALSEAAGHIDYCEGNYTLGNFYDCPCMGEAMLQTRLRMGFEGWNSGGSLGELLGPRGNSEACIAPEKIRRFGETRAAMALSGRLDDGLKQRIAECTGRSLAEAYQAKPGSSTDPLLLEALISCQNKIR